MGNVEVECENTGILNIKLNVVKNLSSFNLNPNWSEIEIECQRLQNPKRVLSNEPLHGIGQNQDTEAYFGKLLNECHFWSELS